MCVLLIYTSSVLALRSVSLIEDVLSHLLFFIYYFFYYYLLMFVFCCFLLLLLSFFSFLLGHALLE